MKDAMSEHKTEMTMGIQMVVRMEQMKGYPLVKSMAARKEILMDYSLVDYLEKQWEMWKAPQMAELKELRMVEQMEQMKGYSMVNLKVDWKGALMETRSVDY